jgi:hypothetical protein
MISLERRKLHPTHTTQFKSMVVLVYHGSCSMRVRMIADFPGLAMIQLGVAV